MFQVIKNILGLGEKPDYREMVKSGAIILDVRTKGEFSGGHIKNALNLPLDQLKGNLNRLKNKDQTIICCCASGMRSGAAKRLLKSQGYTRVFNGGGWMNLQSKL